MLSLLLSLSPLHFTLNLTLTTAHSAECLDPLLVLLLSLIFEASWFVASVPLTPIVFTTEVLALL